MSFTTARRRLGCRTEDAAAMLARPALLGEACRRWRHACTEEWSMEAKHGRLDVDAGRRTGCPVALSDGFIGPSLRYLRRPGAGSRVAFRRRRRCRARHEWITHAGEPIEADTRSDRGVAGAATQRPGVRRSFAYLRLAGKRPCA